MRQGTRGIIERTLSGMAVMGLMMLSLFTAESSAKTEVYALNPINASQNGTASEVWQSVIATADTLKDTVYLFNGTPRLSGSFSLYIQDSTGQGTAGPFYAPPDSVGYRWVRFPVNIGVTRGKTYYFKFSHPSGINYYYAPGTAYEYGRMYLSGSPDQTKDLAVRVIGSGRVLDQWGINLYGYDHGGNLNLCNLGDRMNDMGVNRERDQLILGVKDASDAVWIWRKANPCSIDWYDLDRIVDTMAQKGVEVVFNPLGSPWEWSCVDTLDTLHRWIASEWRMMLYPPKNLRKPVRSGNDVDTSNYYAKFLYELVRRYGPTGYARNGQRTGYFWDSLGHSPYRPVKLWEIENEMNWHVAWADTIQARRTQWQYMGKFFPNRDYNTHDDSTQFIGGDASRQLYWLNLYLRHLAVADTVIHYLLYPNNGPGSVTILTNSLSEVNRKRRSDHPDEAKGKEWLKKFYEQGGKAYSDGITYHAYQGDDEVIHGLHGFRPHYYQMDFDSIRAVMKANGDTGLCWMDEMGWGTTTTYFGKSGYFVSPNKHADCVVQMYTVGTSLGASPYGPLNWEALYQLYDYNANEDSIWTSNAGVVKQAPDFTVKKPAYYAYKQANGKLKDKYFNRKVPLADTSVYAFEFEEPGSGKRTWAVWRSDTLRRTESLSVRTPHADSIMITYNGNERQQDMGLPSSSGKFAVSVDSVPVYIKENVNDSLTRPDVVVDSLWLIKVSGTGDPSRAGDSVRFYARIRNISSTALDSTIADSVSFYVDGVRKVKYKAKRGLGAAGSSTDTLTVGFGLLDALPVDWVANWGDHLIRAWVDSSDKYVELREDNNTGYIFKHIRPKVSLIINSGAKYSNHLSNNSVAVVINGNTTPNPDSTYFWHESGYWSKIPKTTSFDTSVTYSGNGVGHDSVRIFQGSDTALAGDSIIVDVDAPYTAITSPPDSQTVNLNAQVEFWGFSYDFEYHDSLWQIWENSFAWADSNNRVGYYGMIWVPGYFGTWTAWSTGWHTHTLISRDSATNIDTSVVHVYVIDSGGGDGDGFGAGFGSFSSAPMNVTTDPNGNLFVAETQNSKVRKYSPKKDSLFAFSARRSDSTGLNWAVGMALKDSAILYVADGYNHCLKAFDRQGNLLLRFGSFGTDTSQFKQPCGIALDWKDRLWVTDRLNHRIQVFDTTGHFLFQFGSQGQDSGKFNSPTGIAINKYKQVFVSDTKNDRVQVFDSLGNWKKTIKQPDSLGFDTPTGICTDKHGNVFVADTKHNRIVELNPFGKRLFIFGEQGDSLWQFRNPIGVASSPGGHYLYVADMGNKRVTRFWVIRGDTLGGGGPQAGAVVQLLPLVYELGHAIPNPSKGQTTFRYALPKVSRVNMTFYNVAGQVVKEFNQGKQKAGYYSITWDGRSNRGHKVGAGIYFYRLEAGSWVKTRKMVVIR